MLCLPSNPGYHKVQTEEFIRVRSCYFISPSEEVLYSHRFLEYCEMIYVTGGQVYIAVSGREYAVGAGEILVIPCYLTVDGVRRSDGKTSFCTVEFSCSDRIIEGIGAEVVSIQEDSYFIGKLFARLSTCIMEYGNEDNFEGDAILLNILFAIRNSLALSERSNGSVLNSVMDYINESIGRITTIEEIAAHFGYNKDYLLKIFRERYGITIKKYMNDKKLTMVKRLLMTTDMPVSKIGEAIGFEDTELFEKYFKYHEKVTPQRFRKMYR